MSRRAVFTAWAPVALTAALLIGFAPNAGGQRAGVQSETGEGWTPPRTSYGHPDLQGYWTNDTYTPLERPAGLGNKEFYTEEEAAAYLEKRHTQFLAQPRDDVHYDDEVWQSENYPKRPNRRTSLIFDPPDGRLPATIPEADRRAAAAGRAREEADSAQSRSLAERCLSWGNVGPPMIPPSYNANLQIVQTRDHVVINHEMIHDVRIIPLDGRPHLDRKVRALAGDSRGRWEKGTLIVETTGFTGKTNFRGAPRNTRQDIFTSDALRVVERFTPVGPDEIRYRFTVEDPGTWTRPWSGEVPIRRFDGPLYEYACHEANYSLGFILVNARDREKGGAETANSGVR